jgi:hypothetical protein
MSCKNARLDIIVSQAQPQLQQLRAQLVTTLTKSVQHHQQFVIHVLRATFVRSDLHNTTVICVALAITALKRVLPQQCIVAPPDITLTK